jgi:hypothetical protein
MRYFTLTLVFTLLSYTFTFAQSDTNPLSFMVGNWKGSGWVMSQNGKQFTNVTETVACKLDCSVLAVDGLGTQLDSLTNEEVVVHDAYGVISKDPTTEKWMMRAYRMGDVIDAEIKFVGDSVIQWDLPLPSNRGTMRFITDFTSSNKWKETGEYSRDGENWVLIMETELTRVTD